MYRRIRYSNQKKWTASITVEAALVVPLFVFVIVGLLYFMQLIMLQERIQASITEVGKFASRYGYVYHQITENQKEATAGETSIVTGLIDGTLFRVKFLEYMGEDTSNASTIRGGIHGIGFLNSSFMRQDETIEVVAEYSIRIPVLFFESISIPMSQRVKTRAFVGRSCCSSSGEETGLTEKEQVVYVSQYGTKYHQNENCTYLNMKISKVSSEAIAAKRNKNGGKYYPCESCLHGVQEGQGSYYITAYGERYHSSSTCSRIDRTVTAIKISEVGSRTPCSKCGK